MLEGFCRQKSFCNRSAGIYAKYRLANWFLQEWETAHSEKSGNVIQQMQVFGWRTLNSVLVDPDWAAVVFVRSGAKAGMKMVNPQNGEGCSSFLKWALWRHAGYAGHVLTCGKDRIDLALVFPVWFPSVKEIVIAQRFWNAAVIVELEDDRYFVCTKCGV